MLIVPFDAPAGPTALLARWESQVVTEQETALVENAAHSLRLALEREAAGIANQEAAALRRSRQLQRGFLSRLSHELRTPLTAIRGYASSLMAPDVTWDHESQRRFLARIAAESARVGRLVDDLLDFSAIESGVMRLQRDWCDLRLVVEAAVDCLPAPESARVTVTCGPGLPSIWADHDRLEQVFVNLLSNAFRHNPPETERVGHRQRVAAVTAGRSPTSRSSSPMTGRGSRTRSWRRRSRPRGGIVHAIPAPAWACRSPTGSCSRTRARSNWRRSTSAPTFRIVLPVEAPVGETADMPADATRSTTPGAAAATTDGLLHALAGSSPVARGS